VITRSGPWSVADIEDYLEQTVIPVRIATIGSTGPLVQSLWFIYDEGSLWCATQADSVIIRRLRADSRCGFEIAADLPPYRGVRGRGVASIEPDRAAVILPRLIDRYLGSQSTSLGEWLMSRLDTEVAFRIDELTVTSWDYSGRM
jgi:hypothetical protein